MGRKFQNFIYQHNMHTTCVTTNFVVVQVTGHLSSFITGHLSSPPGDSARRAASGSPRWTCRAEQKQRGSCVCPTATQQTTSHVPAANMASTPIMSSNRAQASSLLTNTQQVSLWRSTFHGMTVAVGGSSALGVPRNDCGSTCRWQQGPSALRIRVKEKKEVRYSSGNRSTLRAMCVHMFLERSSELQIAPCKTERSGRARTRSDELIKVIYSIRFGIPLLNSTMSSN